MSHPRTATEWHARRGATDIKQRYVPESGQRSTYRLTVPTDYVKTRSWPLVVGFHGWAFAHDSNPGLHAHGLSNGYIVATPTGYKDDKWPSWNGGGSTRSPGPAGPTCTMPRSGGVCYGATKRGLRRMAARQRLISTTCQRPAHGLCTGATKRGLPQMTDSLVQELTKGVPGYDKVETAGEVCVHTLSPGMVFTDLLLDDSTPELRKFPFGVLAAQPPEVAADLVPKILGVSGQGKKVEFLTTDRVLVKFYQRFVEGQKSEYIDDDGNVIKKPGSQYADNGVVKQY